MNAYELAASLSAESSQMEYGYVVSDWELLSSAANMLRQQADRIAELEEFFGKLNSRKVLVDFILDKKPLTEKEIWEIWNINGIGVPYEFARAIEERHGIK